MQREQLSADFVRSLLDYSPDTGVLRWKARPVESFEDGEYNAERRCVTWNARHAGSIAGYMHPSGYFSIGISDRLYRSHRLAWLIMMGEWPRGQIDHINGDPSDNRWENLRDAAPSENQWNARIRKDSTSGLKGVSWYRWKKKWLAQIRKDGRRIHIGYFDSAEEAHVAYMEAAKRLFGEFARSA